MRRKKEKAFAGKQKKNLASDFITEMLREMSVQKIMQKKLLN